MNGSCGGMLAAADPAAVAVRRGRVAGRAEDGEHARSGDGLVLCGVACLEQRAAVDGQLRLVVVLLDRPDVDGGQGATGIEMGTSKVGSAGGGPERAYAGGADGSAGALGAGLGAGPVGAGTAGAGGGPVAISGVASGARTPGGGVIVGGQQARGGGRRVPSGEGRHLRLRGGLRRFRRRAGPRDGRDEATLGQLGDRAGTWGADGMGRGGTSGAGAAFVTGTSGRSVTAGTARRSSSSDPPSSSSGWVSWASALRCSSAVVVCPKR